MGGLFRRKIQFGFALFLLFPILVSAQTRPDLTGANVVLRVRADAFRDYDLLVIKDGRVIHSENIGTVFLYGRSNNRLVTLAHQQGFNIGPRFRVFELPQGTELKNFEIPNIWQPPLMFGAENWISVDKDTAYFTAYENKHDGIFVKVNFSIGACTITPFPQVNRDGSAARSAGDYVVTATQYETLAYSIPQSAFLKTVPWIKNDPFVFIPRDGAYTWKITGTFTKIADESLDPLPQARAPMQIVRGVLAVLALDSPQADQVLVVLSGPTANGDLRGEPIEPALTFAKPSQNSIIVTVKLPFTPVPRMFMTAQENVIAVIDSKDGTIVKFDCVTHKEVGRIELPAAKAVLTPDVIKVVY